MIKSKFVSFLSSYRCLAFLIGIAFGMVPAMTASANSPALVVIIVIDGLPQEQLVKYRDLYGPGGFRLLLEDGAWYGNAHHGHAVTLTAPGHASVLTGTYPYRNGIIANEWIDRHTLQQVYCTGDSAHTYIGEETGKLDGTSPANLRVSTVGDELRYATGGQSKVIAVSGKDRGAILLAGKRGTAYMYMSKSGRFASRTYYMQALPEWHASYYAQRPQDKWFTQSWTLSQPEASYARSTSNAPWTRNFFGMGQVFPFKPGRSSAPNGAYYAALIATPFGDEATLEFAQTAMEGEQLGRNPAGVTDLLGISLSTHDYVNHAFGPESRQSQDHLLRVDRSLAGFFQHLDRTLGLRNVAIVLTADHGFMNVPEYTAAYGMGGERLNSLKLMGALNEHLTARYGPGNHALRFSYPTIILDQALITKKGLNPADVETAAAHHLMKDPSIAAVYTRTQLETGALSDSMPLSKQVLRAWNRDLSGDFYIVQNPNGVFTSNVATHGSPYTYDTNVPLVFYGPRWFKPGKKPQAAAVVDVAATLSYLLDIRPPTANEGRVLEEILR
jgi:predicted AlkP superfamily pyrophosphatase or phosphodiesterase